MTSILRRFLKRNTSRKDEERYLKILHCLMVRPTVLPVKHRIQQQLSFDYHDHHGLLMRNEDDIFMIMASTNLLSRYLNAVTTVEVYTKEDFDKMFLIPKRVLSFVGIRMTHNITDLQAKCWSLLYWLEMTNILMVVPTEFLAMAVTAINATSFQEGAKMFRMMPCFGTVVMSIFKSMKIKTNRTTFENLHHELREMWKTGKVTEEEYRIISPVSKQLNYIIKGYYWCNNLLLTIFLSPSLYFCLRRYLGYNAPMVLPFDYLLPFNAFQPIFLEITLLLQIVAAVMVIWSNIAWDMLFCMYIAHVTIQFKLLSRRVRMLIYVRVDRQLVASYPLAKIGQKKKEDNEDVQNGKPQYERELIQQRELVNIVKTHHKLIRLTADMEAMFSLALLVNFINSTTIICFCGFCCVLLEKWNEIAYKCFLVTALSQTWFLCWYGQKLIDSDSNTKSLGLSQALYECGWYHGCKKTKNSILIMLVRSQNFARVTTHGFSTISLASYTTIIKTSWSYFTLLYNFYTK